MQKNSRILFIGQLPPPVHGVSIMNEMTICALKEDIAMAYSLSSSTGIRDVGLLSFGKISNVIFKLIGLIKILASERLELVYFTYCPTGWALYRDFLVVILAKCFGLNIILHMHGQGVAKNSSNIIKWIIYYISFYNVKVIHLSSMFWVDVCRFVHKKDFYVVHNCLSDKNIRMIVSKIDYSRLENKLKAKQHPTYLYMSNLMLSKGFIEYLDGMVHLWNSGKEFECYLIGDFKDNESERAFNEWKRKNGEFFGSAHIHVLPGIYDDKKFDLMISCDYFVFPTKIDTYPMVLIEALTCGMKCISTNVGAISEILSDEGVVVDADNQISLNNVLEENCSKVNIAERIRISNRAIKKYSQTEFSEKINRVLWSYSSEQ